MQPAVFPGPSFSCSVPICRRPRQRNGVGERSRRQIPPRGPRHATHCAIQHLLRPPHVEPTTERVTEQRRNGTFQFSPLHACGQVRRALDVQAGARPEADARIQRDGRGTITAPPLVRCGQSHSSMPAISCACGMESEHKRRAKRTMGTRLAGANKACSAREGFTRLAYHTWCRRVATLAGQNGYRSQPMRQRPRGSPP